VGIKYDTRQETLSFLGFRNVKPFTFVTFLRLNTKIAVYRPIAVQTIVSLDQAYFGHELILLHVTSAFERTLNIRMSHRILLNFCVLFDCSFLYFEYE